MSQLGLDGTEVAHPVPASRPLTQRQRDVVGYVRAFGLVRPVHVGVFLGRPPRFAAANGWDMLHRLERRGLVQRRSRGLWELNTRTEDWSS